LILFSDIEKILECYTLNEILEANELTEADALHFMATEEFIDLPENTPV
jgi:hypothetical protein